MMSAWQNTLAKQPSGESTMRSKVAASLAALALAGSVILTSGSASAQRWRGHRGPGWGAPIAGFAAGAIIGGALASRPYYGGYGYYEEPDYAYAPQNEDAVSYCASRYRSYDPASGTFLGYDGLRHSCP
jgi:hypothetical protein